jgi:hypothetical protein
MFGQVSHYDPEERKMIVAKFIREAERDEIWREARSKLSASKMTDDDLRIL